MFHNNRAYAALRAMQQVQHHVAAQPETANGAASVVNQLAAMAQDERYKAQELKKLREEEERRMRIVKEEDDDLFGDGELSYNPSYAGSKRDISQVDSPEESTRHAPSYVVFPNKNLLNADPSGRLFIIEYACGRR
jgi:hypothetical protein